MLRFVGKSMVALLARANPRLLALHPDRRSSWVLHVGAVPFAVFVPLWYVLGAMLIEKLLDPHALLQDEFRVLAVLRRSGVAEAGAAMRTLGQWCTAAAIASRMLWGFGSIPMLLGIVAWRLSRTSNLLRCGKCWYDLSGTPLSSGAYACPECGHRTRTAECP